MIVPFLGIYGTGTASFLYLFTHLLTGACAVRGRVIAIAEIIPAHRKIALGGLLDVIVVGREHGGARLGA